MKIGIFVTGIGVPRGRESNVSGHMQLPLRTCEMLLDQGHSVHVIANEYDEDYVLPNVFPPKQRLPLHLVPDGRRRGRVGMQNAKAGYRPVALFQQFLRIRKLVRELELDVLHLFGVYRMAGLGGILKMMGVGCPVIATIYSPLRSRMWAGVYRRVDALLGSTEYVVNGSNQLNVGMQLLRPGIVRDVLDELGGTVPEPPHRVLFWREASHEAGADLVLEAFDRAAPNHPDCSFDFGLRPNRMEVPGIDELAQRHENVHVYRYPYPDGMSLASLICESLCVVLPFRKLSIHPQFAIAESLLAGSATIASDIGSNNELVCHDKTGLLVPPDNAGTLYEAIEQLLGDRDKTLVMGRAAREDILERWNWDQYIGSLIRVYESHVGRRPSA